jgi:hypothetical protein
MSAQHAGRARSTVMHLRCPDRLGEETYRQVLEQLAELSPTVQALPPTAALVELKGALRFHGTDARHLAEVLRVRTLSRRYAARTGCRTTPAGPAPSVGLQPPSALTRAATAQSATTVHPRRSTVATVSSPRPHQRSSGPTVT